MKVVILHQHFRTPEQGGAIRSYYLAKALAAQSIDVTVITIHNKSVLTVKDVDGIKVHYLPVKYDNRFGFSERASSFIKYIFVILRRPKLFKTADLCYVISTPLTTGIAALWIKRFYRIPFIFEVGDLWPDAPIQLGFIKNPLLKIFLHRLEKSIYRNAHAVIALSVTIQKNILKKAPGKTVHIIPNMADTDFYRPAPKTTELEMPVKWKNKFVISYIGAIGFANGLDYFVECARGCQRAELPVQFVICGDGGKLEGLKNSVQSSGIHNLVFLPFQNREGVKKLMDITDASFICYRTFPILETGSPNKYFDALAAGKLIIINFGGWIKKEIESNQCGIFVDPQHPTDFVKKIRPFLDDSALLKRYQQASRLLAEKEYSRRQLSAKFVSIIEKTH